MPSACVYRCGVLSLTDLSSVRLLGLTLCLSCPPTDWEARQDLNSSTSLDSTALSHFSEAPKSFSKVLKPPAHSLTSLI